MDVKIEPSWAKVLQSEFEKDYFNSLVQFVKNEYYSSPQSTFPPGRDIFRAFNECPFDDVRVVILGQDPYPTKGHAHGLCFSVENTVKPLPKSLNNIYKELHSDLEIEPRTTGDLTHWAKQGVLLLNSVLTVHEGVPDSHANKGWEQFTDEVISILNSHKKNVIYMLWGSKAIRKAENVDRAKNLVLTAPHPSPLSAYRGFFGSKHFSKSNEFLKSKGFPPINW